MRSAEQLTQLVQRAGDEYEHGEFARAAATLAPILREIAHDPNALQLHALVERGLGRLQNAIGSMQKAAALAPQNPSIQCTLGNLLRESGHPQQAAALYSQALEIDPTYPSALHNIAITFITCGQSERAVPYLQRLCEIEPSVAHPWKLLGIAYSDAGDGAKAVAALETAITLGPQSADTYNDLGVAYGYVGRADDARAAYRHAIDIDPQCARAWENLTRSQRITTADRAIVSHMQALLSTAPQYSDASITLCFALGKAFDDLGEFDDAFAHFRIGNEAMKHQLRDEDKAPEDFFEAIAAQQDAQFLAAMSAFGTDDVTPVFVIGMPRSGTTIVEQLLATHPLVHSAGELNIIPRIAQQLCGDAGTYPQSLRHTSAAAIREHADLVLHALKDKAPTARYVVDKLPGNYMYLGLIHILFPRACIVHCRRDALDNALSVYFQRFAHGHNYAYDLAHIARHYRAYRRLMTHWQKVLPQRFLEVDYESLVSAPDEGARQLFAHLGLQAPDRFLDKVARNTAVNSASSWQVRESIHTRSVGRWQHYRQHLGELFDSLGLAQKPL